MPAMLSIHRAFVIHFDHRSDVRTRSLLGRAEHVLSGSPTRFENLEQLLEFVGRVLEAAPPAEGTPATEPHDPLGEPTPPKR